MATNLKHDFFPQGSPIFHEVKVKLDVEGFVASNTRSDVMAYFRFNYFCKELISHVNAEHLSHLQRYALNEVKVSFPGMCTWSSNLSSSG